MPTVPTADAGAPLERLLEAARRIATATGRALWQRADDGRWWLRSHQGPGAPPPAVPPPQLLRHLRPGPQVITSEDHDLARPRPGWPPEPSLPPARWVPPERWVMVPLLDGDRPTGLLLLGHRPGAGLLDQPARAALSRLGRTVTALLRTEGEGDGGRRVDQPGTTAADDAAFATLHRRSAFAIHDLKNLAEILSLCLANAARHRRDPAFVDDLLATLRGAVDKLHRVLADLHGGAGGAQAVDLAACVQGLALARARLDRALVLKLDAPPGTMARVDGEQLEAVLDHLLDNAIEAGGGEAGVELRLSAHGATATIEIYDHGPGMAASFIQGALFTPFASTKPGGLGLGAYQARSFAEAAGGRLEVESAPGAGTIMRLVLPARIPPPVRLAS